MFSLIKQWKLTDLTVKNIISIDDSVKRQITDSVSENLTDSDLERRLYVHSMSSITIFVYPQLLKCLQGNF